MEDQQEHLAKETRRLRKRNNRIRSKVEELVSLSRKLEEEMKQTPLKKEGTSVAAAVDRVQDHVLSLERELEELDDKLRNGY